MTFRGIPEKSQSVKHAIIIIRIGLGGYGSLLVRAAFASGSEPNARDFARAARADPIRSLTLSQGRLFGSQKALPQDDK